MKARSVYEGGKYTLLSLKGTLHSATPQIPGCRLLCEMLTFAGLILLLAAACDEYCTRCYVVGKCCFLYHFLLIC